MSSRGAAPPPARMLLDPGHFLSLGGGSGLIPWAPGTWGSVVGVGVFMLLHQAGFWTFWGGVGVMAATGVPLCGRTSRVLGVKDHGAIVWDEIVGVMIALGIAGAAPRDWLACFLLFRILDILKPWPIRAFDRRIPGGLGIMADDVVAGGVAGLAILLFKYLS